MIPAITADQMREIDRLMPGKIGITTEQMMENAARNIADFSRDFLGGIENKFIVVLCGKGGNGGDGMAAARHLNNWGAKIKCILALGSSELKGMPLRQYKILRNMGVEIEKFSHKTDLEILKEANLVLDCLIGYSLKGTLNEEMTTLIEVANQSPTPIIAVDVPSGLDATTGEIHGVCIQARKTLTLALPKAGLLKEHVHIFTGELFIADISVPHTLYRKIGVKVDNIFKDSAIVKYKIS